MDDILKQAEKAIDILQKHYQDQDHVLVYDNVSTHQNGLTIPYQPAKCPNTPQS